jgi:hypothetical protein
MTDPLSIFDLFLRTSLYSYYYDQSREIICLIYPDFNNKYIKLGDNNLEFGDYQFKIKDHSLSEPIIICKLTPELRKRFNKLKENTKKTITKKERELLYCSLSNLLS